MPTKIQWAGETENPVKIEVAGEMKGYHCTKVSEGCLHCYGERLNLKAGFFSWANGIPYDDREVEFVLDQKVLDRVMGYRKPRRIFWQSMGDLFHEGISPQIINLVWNTMFNTPQHQHIVLTKRPERMKAWTEKAAAVKCWPVDEIWPDWMWLGVTAENQARADERIPVLLETPAAVRFVSIEPMLGPVNLEATFSKVYTGGGVKTIMRGYTKMPKLDWVIVGGETGPGARPVHPDWVRSIRDQCQAAGIPCFFKQWGEWRLVNFNGSGSYIIENGPNDYYLLDAYEWTNLKKYDERKSYLAGDPVFKVGKKIAGRKLDGREWNEYPKS